jgi:putative salt-induced outer membrane protein
MFQRDGFRLALRSAPAAFALIAATAAAEDGPPPAAVPPPPPSPWSGSVAAGYVRTSGNSDSSSLSAKFALNYAGPVWGNQFSASLLNGAKDKVTTEESYSVADKVSYNLSNVSYLFGNGGYDNDRFAGVAERYALTGGYGQHVIATPTQTLDIEGGLGVNRTRDEGTDSFTSRPIATFGGKYFLKISDNAQFTQTLRTEYASNNIFLNPVSELKLTVIGNLFAALDYEIRYNTEVPAQTRHTDTITTVNLGYNFGPKK